MDEDINVKMKFPAVFLYCFIFSLLIRKPFSQNIQYVGEGLVLTGNLTVYPIFYGSWTVFQRNLISSFIIALPSTPWWGVVRKYYYSNSSPQVPAASNLIVQQILTDPLYSLGKSLEPGSIDSLINSNLASGALPADKKAIYIILLSPDTTESVSRR